MMLVVAIIGLMMGAAIFSVRAVTKADLRSAASRTAATLRYAFDRATMTGNTIRIGFDFDKGALVAQFSKGRVAVRKGSKQHHTTNANEAKSADDDDDEPSTPKLPFGGLGGGSGSGSGDDSDDDSALGIDTAKLKRQYEADLAPVKRPKVLFKPLLISKKKRNKGGKVIAFKSGVRVQAVITARMPEPQEKGVAWVYFFPQGHAEPAIIVLTDADGDAFYSVVLHPLTGKAKVYPCKVRIPEGFGADDDSRRRRRRSSNIDDVCAEK